MQSTNNKSANPFSRQAKADLEPNHEISQNGLIWRKLADGSDGVWRYDIRVSGRRRKGTLGREHRDGMTLSQARRMLEEVRAQAVLTAPAGRRGGTPNAPPMFEEASRGFLEWSRVTHADYKHNAERMKARLLPRFGGHRLDHITVGDVEAYRTDLLAEGLSKSTVTRITSLLSCVFQHARQYDGTIENPARGVRAFRPEPKEARIFTEEESRSLWKGCKSASERALVGLGSYAGLRASEVLGLQWRHIDFDASIIQIAQTAQRGTVHSTTKSGRQRRVAMCDALRQLLLQLSAVSNASGQGDFLFPGRNPERPMYQLQETFKRIKKAGGVPDAPSFHGLRHTFATRALDGGLPAYQLQNQLGHSTIQMTMQYVHYRAEDVAQVKAVLDRL
ncbi:tyrosine-type recombinase/integrase [Halofilum ochraceum]|uniref:tyrosine-type recombinase/integrase n=1 Tax=Halofilum ochraceum TaxID=1611323 RepID=UPI0008DB090A|nr:tyrosine-type recombinase/integrase [Halofilum ochraceum]